jgi:MoaA/NifB/PqqE/SkfB family radical SAM enzyme
VNSLEEYKSKLENIDICINENVVPVIVFTAHRKNADKKYILNILDLLPRNCKIAFDTLYKNPLTPNNRGLVLDEIGEKEFWEFILNVKYEYKNKIMNSVTTIKSRIDKKSIKCTAWKNSLYLHYNKYIYPCSTALVRGKKLDLPEKIFSESDFSPYIKCRSCKCSSFLEMHYLQRLEPNLIYQNIRQQVKG